MPATASCRPNVVWICADDYTPDMCGAYGNRVVRTPHLDRLAARGIRFDRAYCACPLSTPSRQAFWTGRYPRSIGVTLSPTPLPDDEVTLPALLRRAGYEVAAFGKTHYYYPRRHEFDRAVDWAEYEDWLARREAGPTLVGDYLGEWRPFADPAAVWLNAAALPYPAHDEEMFGTFLARAAADYLAEPKDRPFFLYVSFYETHSPFWFPAEFRGRQDPAAFAAPAVSPGDARTVPEVFRDLTDADKRGIQAAYATSAGYMDKNVGLVLDAVDRAGLGPETLVLFTSDHGYLLGQHGRFEKHCCYEPAVRAALLMRHEGRIRPGTSTAAMVELIDLLPTVLELCGEAVPANVQGCSLTRLLAEGATRHRDHVVAEYADNEEAMLRTERWKVIYDTGARLRRDGYATYRPSHGPTVRLFDLEADPDETDDLAARPEQAGRVEALLGELAEHLRRTTRDPGGLPRTGDPRAILAHCLPPRDVDLWTYLGLRGKLAGPG